MKENKSEVEMLCGITPENIEELNDKEIFVFGSNLAGIHGAGAAKLARVKFGAKHGRGHGMTGQCYAFPTKDQNIQTIDLSILPSFVKYLRKEVEGNKDLHFLITQVGCGLAGYTPKQIAPMFKEFVKFSNVSLPQTFIDIIHNVQ